MKNFLENLAIYLGINIIVYCLIAFVTTEINPLEWHWFFRLFQAFAALSSLEVFNRNF